MMAWVADKQVRAMLYETLEVYKLALFNSQQVKNRNLLGCGTQRQQTSVTCLHTYNLYLV